jgi:Zn ribbon nucleic-acid-binding protein
LRPRPTASSASWPRPTALVEHRELVACIEDERQIQRQCEERERMEETAGALTRAK